MKPDATTQARFAGWYVAAIEKLKELPGGDGAFVALSTCCFLYEKYAKGVLREQGLDEETYSERDRQFAQDFGTDLAAAEAFRRVIRNGFLHRGTGKLQGESSWSVSGDFPKPVELVNGNGGELRVQPWRFCEVVLGLWQSRSDLLENDPGYPFAIVW